MTRRMIDDGKNLEPPAEPFHRVQLPSLLLQFEMQVVAGGRSRAADQPDALPDADRPAFPYKNPAHVRVQGRVSTLMADADEPPVAPAIAGRDHPAVSCGVYRLALRGGQVHSLMEYPPSLKGMHPAPEPGGDPVAGTPAVKGKQDRVIRQDGDRLPQPSFLRPFPRSRDTSV